MKIHQYTNKQILLLFSFYRRLCIKTTKQSHPYLKFVLISQYIVFCSLLQYFFYYIHLVHYLEFIFIIRVIWFFKNRHMMAHNSSLTTLKCGHLKGCYTLNQIHFNPCTNNILYTNSTLGNFQNCLLVVVAMVLHKKNEGS